MREYRDKTGKKVYTRPQIRKHSIALFNEGEKQELLRIKNDLKPYQRKWAEIIIDSNESLLPAKKLAIRHSVKRRLVYKVIRYWNCRGLKIFW